MECPNKECVNNNDRSDWCYGCGYLDNKNSQPEERSHSAELAQCPKCGSGMINISCPIEENFNGLTVYLQLAKPVACGENNTESFQSLCNKMIIAWESLPEGNHKPKVIEQWLVYKMKPIIDELRSATAKL